MKVSSSELNALLQWAYHLGLENSKLPKVTKGTITDTIVEAQKQYDIIVSDNQKVVKEEVGYLTPRDQELYKEMTDKVKKENALPLTQPVQESLPATTVNVWASNREYNVKDKCAEAFARNDLKWFLDEDNILGCFYFISKADMEKYTKILVPYIIEEYPEIFDENQTVKEVCDILNNIAFFKEFRKQYKSLPIMLYRCFDFVTFESMTNHKNIRIFYEELSREKMEDLRKNGYQLSAAIQEYNMKR